MVCSWRKRYSSVRDAGSYIDPGYSLRQHHALPQRSMDLTISLLLLIATGAFILYKYIVYPALVSPLARLPTAHPLCALTSRWFEQQCTNFKELKTLHAAHQRCGPIIRLGPNEVSVVSEEGLRQVYVAGLDKDTWYKNHFYNYGVQNLVCTLDHKTHSLHKRMISGVYQKSYLQRSPDMDLMSRQIMFDRLLPLLEHSAVQREDVDVVKLFEWTGVDLITAHVFGTSNSTDFIRDVQSRNYYFGEWAKMRETSNYSSKPIIEDFYMAMCKSTISTMDSPSIDGNDSRPIVFPKMYDQLLALNKAAGSPRSSVEVLKTCASEMLDHIIATQETMTIMWTYVVHRLSSNLNLQQRLRSELSTLQPPVALPSQDKGLPSPADIDSLSLLNAVVYETLRLHAANPARLPRVVPKDGMYLHGYYLPGGTTVSSNAYCLNRYEEAYPRPYDWIPERWLADPISSGDKKSFPNVDVLRKYFFAFGAGPRMCIGQHFAVQGSLTVDKTIGRMY